MAGWLLLIGALGLGAIATSAVVAARAGGVIRRRLFGYVGDLAARLDLVVVSWIVTNALQNLLGLQARTMEPVDSDPSPSTSEYVKGHRVDAGISIEELAARVGVSGTWLAAFESGEATEELTYDLLLAFVRATQPPRPEWWDQGHEHDLHLGPAGVSPSHLKNHGDYWARIEAARAINRSSRGRP